MYVFFKGYSSLSLDFIFGIGKQEGESMLPAIVNTIIIIILTLLIAVPIGVCSAIYLNEYSKPGSKIVNLIRLTTESLAGIPSIIFGLFGFLFFLLFLKWSWSILAGVCTMAIMVLPTVMRSTEEALKSVPEEFRQGSYALGAGKLHTIMKITLPSSISGILVAVILSTGRIVGETAALILTAGSIMKIPTSLFSSGSTLSVFMYTLTNEGSDFNKAYATAIVLIFIVLIINTIVKLVVNKLKKI
jgi:phosphate transport system permease protein